MRHKLHITIPTPCHERWDAMDATERGAFCRVCSKEVVDFTPMTDAELISFLEKNNVGCGKFRNEQLCQPPMIQERSRLRSLWQTALALLLPFLSIRTGYCQTADPGQHLPYKSTIANRKDNSISQSVLLEEVSVRSYSKKTTTEVVGMLEMVQPPQQMAIERHDTLIMLPPAAEVQPSGRKKGK